MAEFTGLKTKFQREGTAGVWTDVALVSTIAPPQPSRDVTDVEELDPLDAVKKKLPGLIDVGEVSLTLNFDPANVGHKDLEADFWAALSKGYRILLPNNYAWTCTGFVSGWAPQEISAGDVVQAEVTITLTAKPVLAVYTPPVG